MIRYLQQQQGKKRLSDGWIRQFNKRYLYSISILVFFICSLFLISCSSGKSEYRKFTSKPDAAHRAVFLRNDHSQSCNGWTMFNAGMKKRCVRKWENWIITLPLLVTALRASPGVMSLGSAKGSQQCAPKFYGVKKVLNSYQTDQEKKALVKWWLLCSA